MKESYLKIDSGLKIPYFTFGKNPKVLLMAGMHGDEKTGVVILKELIKKLKKDNHLNHIPPVAIIPCANPEACEAKNRHNPTDDVDLNRIFPVRSGKSHSYKIGQALQKFAENFDVIIDLHVFPKQKTLTCGVGLKQTSNQHKQIINKLLKIFGSDAVCLIDPVYEKNKGGSLCGYLQKQGKLAFGLELPPLEILTKQYISNKISSLLNLLKTIDQEEQQIKHKSNDLLNAYIRRQYYSKLNGTFFPEKNPGAAIKRGDTVGKIKDKTGKTTELKSLYTGTLISISYQRYMNKGEKIYIVGKKTRW